MAVAEIPLQRINEGLDKFTGLYSDAYPEKNPIV